MRILILLFLIATQVGTFAQVRFPIGNAMLTTDLQGGGHDIINLGSVTLGSGAQGTKRLHLVPNGSPTTAADGIGFGSDVALYRSASGMLTLSGSLTVTGSVNGTSLTTVPWNMVTAKPTTVAGYAISDALTTTAAALAYQPLSTNLTSWSAVVPSSFQAYAAELAKVGVKGADIASASSIDLGAATGQFVDITGTADINSFGTAAAGISRRLHFTSSAADAGIVVSSDIKMPYSVTSYQYQAGDVCTAISLGGGVWQVIDNSAMGVFRLLYANDIIYSNGTIFAQTGVTTAGTYNGITLGSGGNTFSLTVGTASITVPPGLSGTLGTAALTNSTAYATSAQGTKADAAIPAPATPVADNVLQYKAGAWAQRTMEQLATDLGLGTAATTAATAYATAAQGTKADAAIPAPASPVADDVLQYKSGSWINRTLAQLATDLLTSGILSKSIYAYKELNLSNYGWAETKTGSAGRFAVNEASIYSGVTTGSTYLLRSSNVFGWMNTPGTSTYYINWSKPKRFIIDLALGRTDANTICYINIGEPYSDSTIGDLTARAVGFRVDNTSLKVSVHDGTTPTITSSLATLTTGSSAVLYTVELQLDGAGGWECFVNGASVGSGTGAPTGLSTQYHCGISFGVTNGAGTSNIALAVTRFAKFENY